MYLCTYIHTYIHTHTHTYIHTYIHTHTHTYIWQGAEWNSDKLWNQYIKFEESRGGANKDARVAKIHLMAALVPTACAYVVQKMCSKSGSEFV